MVEELALARDTTCSLEVEFEQVFLGARVVLQHVHLCCEQGTHTAILGRNGAGKTTLLRAIVGLIPTRGSVKVNGVTLHQLPPLQRARLLAYVPQRSELQARLSVEDVVAQGRFAHRRGTSLRGLVSSLGLDVGTHTAASVSARAIREAHERAIEVALDITDIRALRHRPYPELSGGEQRRVLLARALASEAPVIVLDEPTAGLDISHALGFFEQLRTLTRHGRTVLTVLHQLNDAASWCDRSAVVHDGRIFYDGAPELPEGVVREVYGVEAVPRAVTGYRLAQTPNVDLTRS